MKYLAVAVVALAAAGCARSTPSGLADVVFGRELAQVPGEFVPCLSVAATRVELAHPAQ